MCSQFACLVFAECVTLRWTWLMKFMGKCGYLAWEMEGTLGGVLPTQGSQFSKDRRAKESEFSISDVISEKYFLQVVLFLCAAEWGGQPGRQPGDSRPSGFLPGTQVLRRRPRDCILLVKWLHCQQLNLSFHPLIGNWTKTNLNNLGWDDVLVTAGNYLCGIFLPAMFGVKENVWILDCGTFACAEQALRERTPVQIQKFPVLYTPYTHP